MIEKGDSSVVDVLSEVVSHITGLRLKWRIREIAQKHVILHQKKSSMRKKITENLLRFARKC